MRLFMIVIHLNSFFLKMFLAHFLEWKTNTFCLMLKPSPEIWWFYFYRTEKQKKISGVEQFLCLLTVIDVCCSQSSDQNKLYRWQKQLTYEREKSLQRTFLDLFRTFLLNSVFLIIFEGNLLLLWFAEKRNRVSNLVIRLMFCYVYYVYFGLIQSNMRRFFVRLLEFFTGFFFHSFN